MSRRTVSIFLGVYLWASCFCYAQDSNPVAAFPEQESYADSVDFDSDVDFLSDINFDDWDTPAPQKSVEPAEEKTPKFMPAAPQYKPAEPASD